jgi:aminomethyltransferase
MMKRTPLFAAHQKLGGKLIEFGGWEMPVYYSSITAEHQAVRNAAGIFDISHMGEVIVSGRGAQAFLNRALTNDIRKLSVGLGQYTLMCNEQGGVVDDLYAYRLGETDFLLIVNASRISADVAWLNAQLGAPNVAGDTRIQDVSETRGAVAIQGPKVIEFIHKIFAEPFTRGTLVGTPADLKKNQVAGTKFRGAEIWIGRTGYTGEDGFEIIAPAEVIEAIWDESLKIGAPFGLQAAGLGARDTLRTEVCYPLYGHELDENTTPIEAGLGFFVSLEKGEFNGRTVLDRQKKSGPGKKLVAFKMNERSAPPRPQYPVWSSGGEALHIGQVVSGTQSPSLNVGIGMAYVQPAFAKPETLLDIEIRGRRSPALVVPKPIYRKP